MGFAPKMQTHQRGRNMNNRLLASVVVLTLFLNSGCSFEAKKHNLDGLQKHNNEIPSHKRQKKKMSLEEAKQILQEAEQSVQETKVVIRKAQKKHLTLEEMLEAKAKARKIYALFTTIPSGLFSSTDTSIGAQYNGLYHRFGGAINTLSSIIHTEVFSFSQDLVDTTARVENKLRSSLDIAEQVVSRYPSPHLIKLKDNIEAKLSEVKQESVDHADQTIQRIKEGFKDISQYKEKAIESRKRKLFDDSFKWRIHILDSLDRLGELLRLQDTILSDIKGNMSAVLSSSMNFGRILHMTRRGMNDEHTIAKEQELEQVKSLSVNARVSKGQELAIEAERDILQARAHHKKGDIEAAYRLYDRDGFILERASWYFVRLKESEFGEVLPNIEAPLRDEDIEALRDEASVYTSKFRLADREKNDQFIRGISKRLLKIELSLKGAEALLKRAEKVLRHHNRPQTSEQEQRQSSKASLAD
ncbi:MAG: hypothetical protein EU981_04550 [Candidatus Liberibacter ctenarytainae]|uniref:Uncharacterized protein n=1 Tax=Candidatus Liberibacter ctenarytainae TaxID=2020335 RepID=A0A937AFX0_9HYPH|nr:hypothetical protein [Candidatus Liberibacter ctenarytainae]